MDKYLCKQFGWLTSFPRLVSLFPLFSELLEHDKSVDRERIDNMTEETDGHDLVTDILGDLETAHNVRMIWLNALWRLVGFEFAV